MKNHREDLHMNAYVKTLLLAGSLLLCSRAVMAQRNMDPESFYKAPSSVHGKTVLIPVGTILEGRIDSTIGSSISHEGEQFTITMAAPVLANGVDVIIPSGSQIMGEVVEAIPGKNLHAQKGMPKPLGKLRVQLSGLRTPDGQTYPMVASITGETIRQGRKEIPNTGTGGTAYMGSAASFEAVAPGAQFKAMNPGRPPQVMTREQMMKDPIWGMDKYGVQSRMMGKPVIHSLVQHGQDLVIEGGSPLTIKLDAPFRIGFNPAGSQGATMSRMDQEQDSLEPTMGKRFSHSRTSQAPAAPPDNSSDPMMDQSSTADGGGQFPPPSQAAAPAPPPADSQPPAGAPSQPADNSF